MDQNIRLDVNHMMADMLGSEYGVTGAQLDAMKEAARKVKPPTKVIMSPVMLP